MTENTNEKPEPSVEKSKVLSPPSATIMTNSENIDKFNDFFVDWNKKDLDELVEYLSNKHKFDSSGEAHAIFRLIEWYQLWKEGFKPFQHRFWLVTDLSKNNNTINKFTGQKESNVIGITNDRNKLKSFKRNYKIEKVKFF